MKDTLTGKECIKKIRRAGIKINDTNKSRDEFFKTTQISCYDNIMINIYSYNTEEYAREAYQYGQNAYQENDESGDEHLAEALAGTGVTPEKLKEELNMLQKYTILRGATLIQILGPIEEVRTYGNNLLEIINT